LKTFEAYNDKVLQKNENVLTKNNARKLLKKIKQTSEVSLNNNQLKSETKDIFSSITNEETANKKKKACSIGDYCKGTITGITHFGIFVKLESGETALLHISKISVDKVNNIEEKYAKGEDIEVVMVGRNDKGILLATKEYYELQ